MAGTYVVTVSSGTANQLPLFTVQNQVEDPDIFKPSPQLFVAKPMGAIDLTISGATTPYFLHGQMGNHRRLS
ncbi:MAG: hypothetical protein R2788_12860 [Saprospiraceae bacterium]